MKKLFPVLLLVLILLTSTFTVAYAEVSFRPSITFKPVEVSGEVEKENPDTGELEYYYEIIDIVKDTVEKDVPKIDLTLTAYADKESMTSKEEKKSLEQAFVEVATKNASELNSDIDFNAIAKTIDPEYTSKNLVVSDLFSLELSPYYKEILNLKNNTLTLILKIQGKDKVVSVIHKDEITGKWKEAKIKEQVYSEEEDVNRVKVEFDSLCPVALLKASADENPTPTPQPEEKDFLNKIFDGNNRYINIFCILFAVWAVEMIVMAIILAVKLKKKNKGVKTYSVAPILVMFALFAGISTIGKILICVLIALIAINFVAIIAILLYKDKAPVDDGENKAQPTEEVEAPAEEPAQTVTVVSPVIEEVTVEEEVADQNTVDTETGVVEKPIIDLQEIIDEDYFLDEVKKKIMLLSSDEDISGFGDVTADVEELKRNLFGFNELEKTEGISKETLCAYLAENDKELEIYHRNGFINETLPLPDVYYTGVNGYKCDFVLAFENTKGGLVLFVRMPAEQAEKIALNHISVIKSSFPKVTAGNGWYILKIDDSYDLNELSEIIEEAKNLLK